LSEHFEYQVIIVEQILESIAVWERLVR